MTPYLCLYKQWFLLLSVAVGDRWTSRRMWLLRHVTSWSLCVSCHWVSLLFFFKFFIALPVQLPWRCTPLAAPAPSRPASQETRWASACPARSSRCPGGPPAPRLGNTSPALSPCLWRARAEGNATPWWAKCPSLYFWIGSILRFCSATGFFPHIWKMQSDTSSFGSSRSIKNLRRSNSTTQVNQQANGSRWTRGGNVEPLWYCV